MSKRKKTSQQRSDQRRRQNLRLAHLSPEMRASFRAINRYITNQLSDEDKKIKACAKVRANRRKLISLSGSQNHRCCYCGTNTWHPDIVDYEINRSDSNRATLEHLLPNSQGGTYTWDNLVMACSDCNQARGDSPLEKFLQAIQETPPDPNSKRTKAKVVQISRAKRLKEERSARNRFRLFMIAAWMFSEDYQYFIDNAGKRDERVVLKGGNKSMMPRKQLIKQIRRRVRENRMAA